MLAETVYDAVVLDLYAGSGSLGLEALSRGAQEAYFVERARPAVDVLRSNISRTGSDDCKVLPLPVDRALGKLAKSGMRFDLVFIDPPYYQGLIATTLELIVRFDLLSRRARVIAEHEHRWDPPREVGSLFRIDTRRYGGTSISLYSPFLAQETP